MPRTRDAVTNALYVASGLENKVGAGKLYSVHYTASVNTGSNLNLSLLTTATNVAFVTARVVSTQIVAATLFEGTTVSNAGTTVTAYNHRRDVATAPATVVTHTPTITADGTGLISGFVVPANAANYVPVVDVWMFKADTRYMIRVANSSGSTASISVMLDWYEN